MYRQTLNPEIIIPERYEVERVIADNRFMSAMLAHDTETGEPVFAKARIPSTDHLAAKKISNEANMLGSLHHSRIPGLRDANPDACRPWIITDFVEAKVIELGITPRRRVSAVEQHFKEVNDPVLAAELIASASRVLDYIHERMIVHRDIKPDNLLTTWEEARIADFDIARHIGRAAADDIPLESADKLLISKEYASPEQLSGVTMLDGRSDVHSMGQVLLYFLSGKPPITGNDANEIAIHRAVADHTADLLRRDIPDGLQAVVDRALQKLPENRYQSAGEMAEDLERWVKDNARIGAEAEAIAA